MNIVKIFFSSLFLLSFLYVSANPSLEREELIECMSTDGTVATMMVHSAKINLFFSTGGELDSPATLEAYERSLIASTQSMNTILVTYPSLVEMSDAQREEVINAVANNIFSDNGTFSCVGYSIRDLALCLGATAFEALEVAACCAAAGVLGILTEFLTDGIATPLIPEQVWGSIVSCLAAVGVADFAENHPMWTVCHDWFLNDIHDHC